MFATRSPAIFTFSFSKSSPARCPSQLLTEGTPAVTDSVPRSSSHSFFVFLNFSPCGGGRRRDVKFVLLPLRMWGQIIYKKLLEHYCLYFLFFHQCSFICTSFIFWQIQGRRKEIFSREQVLLSRRQTYTCFNCLGARKCWRKETNSLTIISFVIFA